jgi:hypothetical protein
LTYRTKHQNSSLVLVVFGQNVFSLFLFSLLATASPTSQQNHASATQDYALTLYKGLAASGLTFTQVG